MLAKEGRKSGRRRADESCRWKGDKEGVCWLSEYGYSYEKDDPEAKGIEQMEKLAKVAARTPFA